MADPSRPHIVIIGAMGVGKTTIGRLVGAHLGLAFLDSDELLEARAGESGAEIAARDGVERLHELELDVFLESCGRPGTTVIAAAASVIDHEQGRVALRDNVAVWLTAPDDVVVTRQRAGDHRRGLAADERSMLRRARAPFLAEVSAITVDAGTESPEQLVADLIRRLPKSVMPG